MEDFGVQKHSWQIISQVLFPKLVRKIICYLAVIWLLHLLALLVFLQHNVSSVSYTKKVEVIMT